LKLLIRRAAEVAHDTGAARAGPQAEPQSDHDGRSSSNLEGDQGLPDRPARRGAQTLRGGERKGRATRLELSPRDAPAAGRDCREGFWVVAVTGGSEAFMHIRSAEAAGQRPPRSV
jgi:hypothetical protein